MSEYVIPEKNIIRGDIYPTIENPYEKLVFSGENVVWGNAYGRETVFKGNTLILGNLYSDDIRVENGNLVVLGHVTGKKLSLTNTYVRGSVVGVEEIVAEDSIIKGIVFAPKIHLRNTIILDNAISHSKNTEPVMEVLASTLKLIATTGNLYVNEVTVFIPVIYVKGGVEAKGNIRIGGPNSFKSLIEKIEGFFERAEKSRNPSITVPDPNALQSEVEKVYSIPGENIAVEEGGFITLLGDEIVYEKSRIIRDYIDRLKELLD